MRLRTILMDSCTSRNVPKHMIGVAAWEKLEGKAIFHILDISCAEEQTMGVFDDG